MQRFRARAEIVNVSGTMLFLKVHDEDQKSFETEEVRLTGDDLIMHLLNHGKQKEMGRIIKESQVDTYAPLLKGTKLSMEFFIN